MIRAAVTTVAIACNEYYTGYVAAASPPPNPGLVLLLRLPAGRSSGRVAVWRRLKRLRARPLVGSAWLLADDPETREGVEWLRADVEAEGGIAALLAAQPVDSRAGRRSRRWRARRGARRRPAIRWRRSRRRSIRAGPG